jgi:hypothetical protein
VSNSGGASPNKFILYAGAFFLLLALSLPIPDPLSLLLAAISATILVVGSLYAARNWISFRGYKPRIKELWAEGTIFRQVTVKEKNGTLTQYTTHTPCVYISAKLDPKNEIIHNCEVEVKPAWFAQFETAGYDRYDVQREEIINLGRYEIDIPNHTMVFLKPIHEAQTVRPYGGWNGERAELKSEKLELAVVGEVEGKRIQKKIPLEVNVKDLLKSRRWQQAWMDKAKPMIDSANEIIDDYLRTL